MKIRRAVLADLENWFALRKLLWAHVSKDESRAFLEDSLHESDKMPIFLAESGAGEIVGFLEAALRFDYVEGCETSPVGYIEGWFVAENFRQQEIGRKLVEAAESWARALGCREMASDCLLENTLSLKAHLAIGYEEVERNIHFKKNL